jgi:hypothetical protein
VTKACRIDPDPPRATPQSRLLTGGAVSAEPRVCSTTTWKSRSRALSSRHCSLRRPSRTYSRHVRRASSTPGGTVGYADSVTASRRLHRQAVCQGLVDAPVWRTTASPTNRGSVFASCEMWTRLGGRRGGRQTVGGTRSARNRRASSQGGRGRRAPCAATKSPDRREAALSAPRSVCYLRGGASDSVMPGWTASRATTGSSRGRTSFRRGGPAPCAQLPVGSARHRPPWHAPRVALHGPQASGEAGGRPTACSCYATFDLRTRIPSS